MASEHDRRAARLQRELTSLRAGAPVRLGKRTSNLFRLRPDRGARLDATGLDGVIAVDPNARTADVQGMTTYERLVDATLPHGLMPLVVPQLKTITIGGAVAGLGIESSSFRSGMPHESVREMEILAGDGRLVRARPDGDHSDLFFGFPNSYGTLGYALRLTIELEPVLPFVRLRHLPFATSESCFEALAAICASRVHDGERVDFVDGVAFAEDALYLTVGTFVGHAAGVSDYTGRQIYYRSIPRMRVDHLRTRDYLWRWDTDWFWCSRAFGVQNPWVRALVPRRYLRSDVYWRLVSWDRRWGLTRRIDRRRGRPPAETVIQDVQVPIEHAPEFLAFFHREIGIKPIWLCPIRQRDPRVVWSLYPLVPEVLYVNFGFWSSVPLRPGEADGTRNRLIERKVEELGGRKSLYSTSWYSEEEFWGHHNGEAYAALKKAYDPDGRLPNLYEKCVREGR